MWRCGFPAFSVVDLFVSVVYSTDRPLVSTRRLLTSDDPILSKAFNRYLDKQLYTSGVGLGKLPAKELFCCCRSSNRYVEAASKPNHILNRVHKVTSLRYLLPSQGCFPL